MSSLSQFTGGSAAPKNIVNAFSAGSFTSGTLISGLSGAVGMAKTTLSGALTANTLATILDITGGGVIDLLAAYTADTTSRTIRMKVTIDGVVAFDATTAAIVTAGAGAFVLGSGSGTSGFSLSPVPFKSSLKVEVASSLSETDKITVASRYYTT